jgi:hypothetical protein
LSVFKLKNPFGFQDEFWHLFTCIWYYTHLYLPMHIECRRNVDF